LIADVESRSNIESRFKVEEVQETIEEEEEQREEAGLEVCIDVPFRIEVDGENQNLFRRDGKPLPQLEAWDEEASEGLYSGDLPLDLPEVLSITRGTRNMACTSPVPGPQYPDQTCNFAHNKRKLERLMSVDDNAVPSARGEAVLHCEDEHEELDERGGSPFPGSPLPASPLQDSRDGKKRRKSANLKECEKWYCVYNCGKFYHKTSTRSIHKHMRTCSLRTREIMDRFLLGESPLNISSRRVQGELTTPTAVSTPLHTKAALVRPAGASPNSLTNPALGHLSAPNMGKGSAVSSPLSGSSMTARSPFQTQTYFQEQALEQERRRLQIQQLQLSISLLKDMMSSDVESGQDDAVNASQSSGNSSPQAGSTQTSPRLASQSRMDLQMHNAGQVSPRFTSHYSPELSARGLPTRTSPLVPSNALDMRECHAFMQSQAHLQDHGLGGGRMHEERGLRQQHGTGAATKHDHHMRSQADMQRGMSSPSQSPVPFRPQLSNPSSLRPIAGPSGMWSKQSQQDPEEELTEQAITQQQMQRFWQHDLPGRHSAQHFDQQHHQAFQQISDYPAEDHHGNDHEQTFNLAY
jgi:hypothetical protein